MIQIALYWRISHVNIVIQRCKPMICIGNVVDASIILNMKWNFNWIWSGDHVDRNNMCSGPIIASAALCWSGVSLVQDRLLNSHNQADTGLSVGYEAWPLISQIPQCTCLISHNAPHWNRNEHISVPMWCIVGYGTGALWDLGHWLNILHFVFGLLWFGTGVFYIYYLSSIIYFICDDHTIAPVIVK